MGLIPAGALKGSWSGRLCRKAKDDALDGDSENLSLQCLMRLGAQGKPSGYHLVGNQLQVAWQTNAVSRGLPLQESNYRKKK